MGINPRNVAIHTYGNIYQKTAAGIVISLVGFYIGFKLDRIEANRWDRFRDKSLMFGKIKKEGETLQETEMQARRLTTF